MKKILSILCGCFMAMNVFAFPSITTIIDITLSSTNGEDRTISLYEGPTFSDAYDDGFDSADPNATGFYVLDENGGKWLSWASNNLEGTRLGFTANTLDEDYTLTFSNVSGRELYIFDATTGTATKIESGLTVPFSINSAQAGLEVNLRFSVLEDAPVYVAQVTTNDYGWASFSYNQDLVPVNSAIQTLYKGAINGEYLDLTAVDYVPNGQGVLVKGEANATYYFAAGSGSDDFTGNALRATATYNTSMQNVFVLKGNAFLEYVGTNALADNKAYIQLPSAGPNNAPKRITMRFNGTTAVDNVEAESVKAEKFVENGQVYIRRGNEVYNLQGQIIK